MTDRQRLALLDKAVAELRQTRDGFTESPNGPHWRPAMRDLEKLAADLSPPSLELVHPIPKGVRCVVGAPHRTAGDVTFAENWARDFIVAAGTPILAVEAATVTKLSGHDPRDDDADRNGVYGWSIHYESDDWHYFLTHLGVRAPLKVGDRIAVGQELGKVGDQRFRPDHAHLGATAIPSGSRIPAIRRMDSIVAAPRLAA